MSDCQDHSKFVTAFTTEDADSALKLRDLIEEAGIRCQLVRGLVPADGEASRLLVEIKVDRAEMETVAMIIDANQAIGHFGKLEPLPVETVLPVPVPIARTVAELN